MNLWSWLIIAIIFTAVSACAPPQQQTTPQPATPPAVIPPEIDTTGLSCAKVDNSEALTILYGTEKLYANGAVFPGDDGLSCLKSLADWLKNSTSANWQVMVGAEEGFGFDQEKLAMKRQELLQRYFQRQGLNVSGWGWQTSREQGLQLQFTSLP